MRRIILANIEDVSSLGLFANLNTQQKEHVATISRVIRYPKNGILYYESDLVDDLLFLQEGLLKIYKVDKFDNEIFLYHIYPNEMISELSSVLVNKIFCYSNAEFTEDSKILAINYEAFKNEFLTKNILTIEFIEELAKKSQKLQCIINRELVFDSTAKVAYLLCNDLKMFNNTKRNEISFMLHIQPETLSRVLSKFKRSEFIEINPSNSIEILDRDELESIYRGIKI